MSNAKTGLMAEGFDPGKCYVPGCQNRWSVHVHGERPMCSMHYENGIAPEERLVREAEKPFTEVEKDDDL